jgi:N-acyl-D-aspartate/D-glutamate deacylase
MFPTKAVSVYCAVRVGNGVAGCISARAGALTSRLRSGSVVGSPLGHSALRYGLGAVSTTADAATARGWSDCANTSAVLPSPTNAYTS